MSQISQEKEFDNFEILCQAFSKFERKTVNEMKLSFAVLHFILSLFSLKITLKVINFIMIVKFVGLKFKISARLLVWLCHVTFVQVLT